MTKLEERIRSGFHETAQRIPESGISDSRTKLRRPTGVWIGVAAALVVLLLFVPLAFILGSDPAAPPANQEPAVEGDVIPAEVGFEFANPEHVRLRFAQDLTLSCEGLETIDNGGFDSFDMDIWVDHRSGFTRLGLDYPDGSTYDLILKGRPGAWEHAWGSGTDLGRSAGCREPLGDGGYDQSIAGWAFQDSSELWFADYLKPVNNEGDVAIVNQYDRPTPARSIGVQTYLIETNSPDGAQSRFEFTLDVAGVRVIGETRYIYVPDQFEASATIEVLESGPATMPVDIFDPSNLTPLWGNTPVGTTAVTP